MIDFKYDIESGNLFLLDSGRLESLVKNILKKGFKLGDNTIYLRPTYIDMDGNPIQNNGNIYPKTSGTYSLGSLAYKWLNAYLSGTLFFGDDVNLYRSDVDILKTDDIIEVGGDQLRFPLTTAWNKIGLYPHGSYPYYIGVEPLTIRVTISDELPTKETFFRIYRRTGAGVDTKIAEFSAKGQLRLPITGSDGGILIGGDTNLYRSAADVLKTDDNFDTLALRIGGTEVLTSGRVLQNIASVAQTLLPDTDASRDLGSSIYRWRNLLLAGYANIGSLQIDGTEVLTSGKVLQNINYINQNLLVSIGNQWGNNILYLSDSNWGIMTYDNPAGSVYDMLRIMFYDEGSRAVSIYGTRSNSDLFRFELTGFDILTGGLKIGGAEIIDSSRILKNLASIAQTILPDTDNTRDLGSLSYRWRDAFFSRDIYLRGL